MINNWPGNLCVMLIFVGVLCIKFLCPRKLPESCWTRFSPRFNQTSVSRCIDAVTNAIVTNLLDTYIKYPTTDARKLESKRGFMDKFHIPGIIGAIDCSHIAIVAPPTEHETTPGVIYINRKGYHSINVQLVCTNKKHKYKKHA